MIVKVMFFRTKQEAEKHARWIAGSAWRHCCKVEPAGFNKNSGWILRMYEADNPKGGVSYGKHR
jgi:hypothetical protein